MSVTVSGIQRKLEGLERVEANNKLFLEKARQLARYLSSQMGGITAEDVRGNLAEIYPDLKPTHVNAWGTVFKHPGWVTTGWAIAKRPEAHARPIRVWRYDP